MSSDYSIDNRNFTPFYYDAFQTDMFTEWSAKDTIDFSQTIEEMSYNRAICCQFRDGLLSENQRRDLMYWFLRKSGFGATKETDLVNAWYATLPIDNNFLKRIARNLCNVYNEPPTRQFFLKDKPVSDDIETLINDAIEESKFNLVMKTLHKNAKMCGQAAAHPRIRNGSLQIQILFPDQYQVVKDGNGKVIEVWIPYFENTNNIQTLETSEELRYEVWTDKDVRIKNYSGKDLTFSWEVWVWDDSLLEFVATTKTGTRRAHNYGIVPFAFLDFDINDNDGTESKLDSWELIKKQMECNLIDLLTRENIVKSFALWVLKNWDLKTEDLSFGHGSILMKNGVNSDLLDTPTADALELPQLFNEFEELKIAKMKNEMKMQGLPTSLVDDNPGLAASGEAMKVDRLELEEVRKEDIALLKAFEFELLNLLLLVANIDGNKKYAKKFQTYTISIDYKETDYLTYEQKKDNIEERRKNGTIGVLEYYKFYYEDDNIKTSDDAIKAINQNLQEFEQIKGLSNGAEIESRNNERTDSEDESAQIDKGSTGNTIGNIGTNEADREIGESKAESKAESRKS